jgi:hypothetical protein
MTVITLFLAVYSSNTFAINEKSSSTLNTTFPALSAYNNSSTIKNNNQNHSTANLKESQQNNILITKLLAKNLENHLQKAGSILEITSKLPQVRDVSFANTLNQTLNTLHGIPQNTDIEKRQVAGDILSSNSDLFKVFLVLSNGNMYLLEPYPIQKGLTANNYAFRDYFQGAIKTNGSYLGNVIISTAASHDKEAVIAAPVYSPKDNSTIVGVLGGSIDFGILNKELQSFNITTSAENNNNNNMRAVYVGHLGQKVADSDVNKSKTSESFASLQSFKNAINGQSGSIIDTVNNTKMLVTYQPVKALHNTYAVLLMQPLQQQQ